MSSGALRAAWEAAQKGDGSSGNIDLSAPSPLRKAWEDAQRGPSIHDENKTGNLARRMATNNATDAAESSEPSGTTWRELLTHPGDIPEAGARAMMATEANLSHGVPGMKAVQAFVRSKTRGQSYREALADIEGETKKIPETLSAVEKGVGAAPAALAMPASTIPKAIASAVALSGAGELANPNPDVGPEERAANAGKAAMIGGGAAAVLGGAASVIPKVAKTVSLARRVKNAPTLGETAQKFENDISAATQENYGKAAAEGEANGGTSPALAKVLERPRIKQYVDMVRDGEEPMSDAEVTREVSKLMSKARRGHQTFMEKNGYDAARDLEAKRLGKELKILRDATAEVGTETRVMETAPSPKPTVREAIDAHQRRLGQSVTRKEGTTGQQMARTALERHGAESEAQPPIRGERTEYTAETDPAVMPSFPHAVAEKARMEGERGLFNDASDAAKRIMRGTSIAGKDLRGKTPEAWREMIAEKVAKGELSKSDAEAAIKAFLGRAKEEMRFKLQPGVVRNIAELRGPASRLNRAAPFIDQLDRAAGTATKEPFDAESFQKLLISYLSTRPQRSQP